MKQHKSVNNVKLGIFVMAGVVFLVFSLYMIGRNRNLFGPSFTISTYFPNINGLVAGNNVRFAGIDVGTVKRVVVIDDTSVLVEMTIDRSMIAHIRENSIASIGTDGLVGNKIVNINSVRGEAPAVRDGSTIKSRMPLETDEMLRTLQTTNLNIAVISANLREASARLNGSASLWNILADTVIAQDLQLAVSHFRSVGANTAAATKDAQLMIRKLKEGDGVVNSLFTDSALRLSIESSFREINGAAHKIDSVAGDLKRIGISNNSKGPIRFLLSDSLATMQLSQALLNVEQGTDRFNENMEAMRSNFLFRRYFKKKAKKPSPHDSTQLRTISRRTEINQ